MAFAAAARRAASRRILTAAATTATSHPLAAATQPLLLAAAGTTGTPRPLAASTPPLLLAAAGTTAPLRPLAATTPPLLLAAAGTTASLRPLAATIPPLLLAAAGTTASPRPLAASTPLLLSADATSLPTNAATPLLLGRHDVFSHAPASLSRRRFSNSILGDRSPVSAPAYLATAGSMLARRGMCTEALTPAVQRAIDQMAKDEAARHENFLKELDKFELEMASLYSAAVLKSAENSLTAGKVAWRVSTAVLAFGVATLVAVLQVIKDGWRVEFQAEVEKMMEQIVDNLKSEITAMLPDLVRKEIQAQKAAPGTPRK